MTKTRKNALIGAGAGLIIVLVVGGMLWARKPKNSDQIARVTVNGQEVKLTADQKRSLDNLPNVRLASGEVDPDDRRRLMNSFAPMRTKMLDDYFALDKEGRKKALDTMIDEQEKMKKLIDESPPTQPATQPGDGTQPRIVRRIGSSPADQKQMTEDIAPADRARMAEMIADMNARRAERGLPPGGGFVIKLNATASK